MTENIKWALQKMVKELNWMDDETKNATLLKLANTKSFIGYPTNYTRIINILFQDVRYFCIILNTRILSNRPFIIILRLI